MKNSEVIISGKEKLSALGHSSDIDVGVFFSKRNARINEPVANILKKNEIEKFKNSKFRETSSTKAHYTFETQANIFSKTH